MTILDYIILGLAAIGLIIGLVKGFLNQLLGLLGIVAVAVGTAKFYHIPAGWFVGTIESQSVRTLVGLIVTAVVLAIVCIIISNLLLKIIKKIKVFGVIDRILGLLLGVGMVYAIVAILVSLVMNPDDEFMKLVKDLLSEPFQNSWVITNIFKTNPLGDWIVEMITAGQV